jgi:hypothetical protein
MKGMFTASRIALFGFHRQASVGPVVDVMLPLAVAFELVNDSVILSMLLYVTICLCTRIGSRSDTPLLFLYPNHTILTHNLLCSHDACSADALHSYTAAAAKLPHVNKGKKPILVSTAFCCWQ